MVCVCVRVPQWEPREDLRPVQQGGLQLLHSSRHLHRVCSLLLLPAEAQQAEGDSIYLALWLFFY